jgi:hypothetical protein
MRSLLVLAVLAALAGCGSRTETEMLATVIDVYEDKAPMGCMGTDWNTVVKTADLRVERLCGKFGKPGDTIKGCWYVSRDPLNPTRAGFTTSCTEGKLQ